MIIEQPPLLYRLLHYNAIWRIKKNNKKIVYLTFDDGPIPEVTPWVLDILDKYKVKATFFCVGDNVRKYPQIYQELLDRGHCVGNHTFNHLQGWLNNTNIFVENIQKAATLIQSNLFRPPHGHIWLKQRKMLQKMGYKLIMWDVVTRDYSKLMEPEQVLYNVKKYTRNGSVIVFHDSLRAEKNMKYAMPKSIEWLMEQGYEFGLIGSDS